MYLARYYILHLTPGEKALVHNALVNLKVQFEEQRDEYEHNLDKMIYRMQILPELKSDDERSNKKE